MDGWSLRAGQQSVLTAIGLLTKAVNCPKNLQIFEQSTLIIDGQALVVTLGKPQNAASFGDLAYIFVKCNHVKCNEMLNAMRCFHEEGNTNYMCASGRYYNHINVFDRYDKLSIKSGIRNWRIRGALKRMNIQTKDVPLPLP